MTLVANARMYTVNAAVDTLWREVLAWIGMRADVALDVIEHAPPAPLRELWERHDIGTVAMCGYPLASWRGPSRPIPLAAPAPTALGGRAVYWTDIIVRADSRFRRDDDLAATRFGWTTEDSQSGYQAPRRHFATRALERGGSYFASTVGALVTPRRVVQAVIDGTIDAGPLDAYWHALLRRHEPQTAQALRVVATTVPTPIPCFVAASTTPAPVRERLSQAFVDVTSAPELQPALLALELAGFERVDASTYDVLIAQSRAVDALDYPTLR